MKDKLTLSTLWKQTGTAGVLLLTSALHGGEWPNSRPVRFVPFSQGKNAGTHRTGGSVGPQPFCTFWRRKTSWPCQDSIPGCPARCLVTDYVIRALCIAWTHLIGRLICFVWNMEDVKWLWGCKGLWQLFRILTDELFNFTHSLYQHIQDVPGEIDKTSGECSLC